MVRDLITHRFGRDVSLMTVRKSSCEAWDSVCRSRPTVLGSRIRMLPW